MEFLEHTFEKGWYILFGRLGGGAGGREVPSNSFYAWSRTKS